MAYQTQEQLRRRDAWIRRRTVDRIRERFLTEVGFVPGESDHAARMRILDEEAALADMAGKIVHHKDGDPTNNDPENLVLR